MSCVLQPWVTNLSMMQQTVLLTVIRGPDGVSKYQPPKMLLRWYRRCILYSAMDQRIITDPVDIGGGSFTGPSIQIDEKYPDFMYSYMNNLVSEYLQTVDNIPHHFQMHFMHAIEILGYKHPDMTIKGWWYHVYLRLVKSLHLYPELESQLDERLGDNRENWIKHNDEATLK